MKKLEFLGLVWLAAFVIVMALFLLLGDFLARLSLPLRALIVSGVLVLTMTQVVVPRVGRLLKMGPAPPTK